MNYQYFRANKYETIEFEFPKPGHYKDQIESEINKSFMTFQERVDYLLSRPIDKRSQIKIKKYWCTVSKCNWEFSSDADEKKHKKYFHSNLHY